MKKVVPKTLISTLIAAIVGTLLIVSLFAKTSFHINSLQFRLGLALFDHGMTEMIIPPVGSISANTHDTPLKFTISLEHIDVEMLREIMGKGYNQQKAVSAFNEQLQKILKVFFARVLFLAVVGGSFGIFLLRAKKVSTYVVGSLIGLTLMGALVMGTYITYDVHAFRTPKYEGIIQMAPWMINFAEEALGKIEKLGDQMEVMANNLYQLYSKVDKLGPVSEDEKGIHILQVSDIHNNPAAYDFIRGVVKNFDVDAIVDIGDLSDFGTPLEAKILNQIKTITIPYIIIVSGNHDSPQIVETLKKIDNVSVLEGNITNLLGLRVLGIGDPAAVSNRVTPPNVEISQKYISRLNNALEKYKPVDMLMVHNPGIAHAFSGQVPVILHGHDHQLKIEEEKDSIIIDAGTSGAAGIRGLYTSNEVPYSVVLLHFRRKEGLIKLTAADSIKVFNLRTGFELKRTIFNSSDEEK